MKMPRPSGPVRRAVKILVAALMLAAVTAAFFGVRACAAAAKVQLVPALLAADSLFRRCWRLMRWRWPCWWF